MKKIEIEEITVNGVVYVPKSSGLSPLCGTAGSTKIREHLEKVLQHAEQETCLHEETHRGGDIWEICDCCGMQWADDRGGKPEDAHEYPKVLRDARTFLESM